VEYGTFSNPIVALKIQIHSNFEEKPLLDLLEIQMHAMTSKISSSLSLSTVEANNEAKCL
jgi:hypothetical protein